MGAVFNVIITVTLLLQFCRSEPCEELERLVAC